MDKQTRALALLLMREQQYSLSRRDLLSDEQIAVFGKKGIPARSRNAVTCISYINAEGKIDHANNQACHASMNYPEIDNIVACVSSIQDTGGVDDKIKRSYLDWLCNRSPYSEVFNSKSANWMLKNKCVITGANYPANLLAGAMIATRAITEYTSISETWYRLKNLGINENLAFCIAHCVRINDGVVSVSNKSGHCALSYSLMSKDGTKNFVHSIPEHKIEIWGANGDYGYHGIHALWGGAVGDTKWLYNLCEGFVGRSVIDAKAVDNNPFKREEKAVKCAKKFASLIKLNVEGALV